jgi:hypothetical protein
VLSEGRGGGREPEMGQQQDNTGVEVPVVCSGWRNIGEPEAEKPRRETRKERARDRSIVAVDGQEGPGGTAVAGESREQLRGSVARFGPPRRAVPLQCKLRATLKGRR